jgi:hypothetical protein
MTRGKMIARYIESCVKIDKRKEMTKKRLGKAQTLKHFKNAPRTWTLM